MGSRCLLVVRMLDKVQFVQQGFYDGNINATGQTLLRELAEVTADQLRTGVERLIAGHQDPSPDMVRSLADVGDFHIRVTDTVPSLILDCSESLCFVQYKLEDFVKSSGVPMVYVLNLDDQTFEVHNTRFGATDTEQSDSPYAYLTSSIQRGFVMKHIGTWPLANLPLWQTVAAAEAKERCSHLA